MTRSTMRLIGRLVLTACVLLMSAGAWSAQSSPSLEYEIKAGLLVNFVKLITWPEDTFADSTTPFTIGVLGRDPFGVALERVAEGQTVHGRTIAIRRSGGHHACQLLFVSSTESENISRVLQGTRGLPIVTVSELEGFAEKGGVIEFYIEDNMVRFAINVDAAERAGVRIDNGLLEPARVVRDNIADEEPDSTAE